MVPHHGGFLSRAVSSGWSLIRAVFHKVVFHLGGHSSDWYPVRVVSHQGGTPSGWSLIRVVPRQGGLSSGWFCQQGDNSSGQFHQGGLSLGQSFMKWSFIRVVPDQGSFIRVVSHQGSLSSSGLSSKWSFISVVVHL